MTIFERMKYVPFAQNQSITVLLVVALLGSSESLANGRDKEDVVVYDPAGSTSLRCQYELNSEPVASEADWLKQNPNGVVIPMKVHDHETPMMFAFKSEEDLIPAAGLHLYSRMCDHHQVPDINCPNLLRIEVMDILVARAVDRFCSIFRKALPGKSEEECRTAAQRKCKEASDLLVAQADHETNWSMPTFSDFESTSSSYAALCDELQASAVELEPMTEGGIWSRALKAEDESAAYKTGNRKSFVLAVADVDAASAATGALSWTYLEVGFNAGHSAAIILTLFPRAVVVAFDLCSHVYTWQNYKLLQKRFGKERLHLTCGDSRDTIATAVRNRAAKIAADVVRVDGGHHFSVAAADIVTTSLLAKAGALMIVDDCEFPQVLAAWQVAVDLGVVATADNPLLAWNFHGSCSGRVKRPPV